ncbi:hypothetical protein BRC96_08950 [Halobacteriales archaeon QS_6_64_34]|nr:MAG: hypothetical protein BRC96_08950 [Halobacteriales archaeon QS_6_64_34]
MVDDDREPSLLTNKHRDFLAGADVSESYARKLKVRIRERVRDGILDAPLILQSDRLRDRDIREIFRTDKLHTAGKPAVAEAIIGLIALIYRGLLLNAEDGDPTEGFAGQIREGVILALNREGIDAESVRVDITVERGEKIDELSVSDLAEKYTRVEMREMLHSGTISDEKFVEYVKKVEGSDSS